MPRHLGDAGGTAGVKIGSGVAGFEIAAHEQLCARLAGQRTVEIADCYIAQSLGE
ncbi:hypothetical protein D3C84_1304590 [compost metagenome]